MNLNGFAMYGSLCVCDRLQWDASCELTIVELILVHNFYCSFLAWSSGSRIERGCAKRTVLPQSEVTPEGRPIVLFRIREQVHQLILIIAKDMHDHGVQSGGWCSVFPGSICVSGFATPVVNCGTARVPMGLPM